MTYVDASIKKFILYLLENGYLDDGLVIVKADAREIYNGTFKKDFSIKVDFGSLIFHGTQSNLITRNRNRTIIKINPNKIGPLRSEKSQIDLEVENGKYFKKNLLVSQNIAFRAKKKSGLLISPTECKLCKVKFNNHQEFLFHVTIADHIFHADFVQALQSSKSRPTHYLNFMVMGFGSPKNVMLRKNERTKFTLLIINDRNVDCDILELKYVRVKQIDLKFAGPVTILKKTRFHMNFTVIHKEDGILYYPVLFVIQFGNDKKEVPIEMVFHVQSSDLDDLQPVAPYKKVSKPVIQEFVEEINLGEPPERSPSSFLAKTPLKSYPLTKDFSILLNAGLKAFPSISEPQQKLLQKLKNLLNVKNTRKCLNIGNYWAMLDALLYFEEHQMKKDIRDYDSDNQVFVKVPGSNLLELNVPGLAEHRPSLVKGDSVYVREKPNSTVLYQGIVHRVKMSSVYLGFCNKFVKNIFLKGRKFFVSFDYNRHTLKVEHQAVEFVRKHNISKYFFPKTIIANQEIALNIAYRNPDISKNLEQQQAIRSILARTSYPSPYLIFGPPGTGKTVTVTETVEQILMHKPNDKILICTPSNSAANVLTSRLAKRLPTTDLFRYVAPSFPSDLIPENIKKFVNFEKEDYYHPAIKELMKFRVVVTTLVTASRCLNGGLDSNHFQYVFIDESGHATESETLISLAGVVSASNQIQAQIVLAGDPQQLGPIIHSKLAMDYGFGTSMLERLMTTCAPYAKDPLSNKYNPNALTKLVKNYRSHPLIIQVPNDLFYDGELKSCGNPDLIHLAVGWKGLPNPKVPMIFHSVVGADVREESSPSFFNVQEIAAVLSYLNQLIGSKDFKGRLIKQEDIGIISPYKKQVEKLNKACQKKNYNKIDIGSVEFFQGQERLIIIISTVRSNPDFLHFDHKFHLGFLKNPKRMNVAVTRAKSLLIVIGNPNILQFDINWRKLIQFCHINNAIAGQRFNLLEDDDVDDDILESFENLTLDEVPINRGEGQNFSRGNI